MPLEPDAASAHGRALDRIGVMVVATDTIAVLGGFLAAHVLRYGLHVLSPSEFLVLMVLAPAWVVIAGAWRLHQFFRFSPAEEFRRVVSAVSLCVVLVWTLSFWSKGFFSRSWIGLSWMISLIFILSSRWLWHAWLAKRRATGALQLRTVIVGTNEEGGRVADLLQRSNEFQPVGFVSTVGGDPTLDGLPRVGDIDELRRGLVDLQADCLFVASSAVDHQAVADLMREARRLGVEFRLTANVPDVLSTRLSLQPVGGTMTLSLKPVTLSGPQAALKRGFDLLVSAFALIVSAPFFAAIAVAIRVESRGPALFRQPRVTLHGRQFTLLKFRTMQVGAEALAQEWGLDTSEPYFKVEQDARVTGVGRLLRKTSLDELPQLWNVLVGDMSLVGPRPLPVDQVRAHEEMLARRHEVRSGLTGWWQIHGRSHLHLDEALRMDTFYIENWSFSLDLYVLLRTVGVVLRGRGAY